MHKRHFADYWQSGKPCISDKRRIANENIAQWYTRIRKFFVDYPLRCLSFLLFRTVYRSEMLRILTRFGHVPYDGYFVYCHLLYTSVT